MESFFLGEGLESRWAERQPGLGGSVIPLRLSVGCLIGWKAARSLDRRRSRSERIGQWGVVLLTGQAILGAFFFFSSPSLSSEKKMLNGGGADPRGTWDRAPECCVAA